MCLLDYVIPADECKGRDYLCHPIRDVHEVTPKE